MQNVADIMQYVTDIINIANITNQIHVAQHGIIKYRHYL